MTLHEYFYSLINTISTIDEVLSIGKSGGEKLPIENESDIDIFVFCSQVPNYRNKANDSQELKLCH